MTHPPIWKQRIKTGRNRNLQGSIWKNQTNGPNSNPWYTVTLEMSYLDQTHNEWQTLRGTLGEQDLLPGAYLLTKAMDWLKEEQERREEDRKKVTKGELSV